MTTSPVRPITRVLVANRGEIARRVFATCRRLGIGTAAVYSDADAGLPFVAEADVAVRLPGYTPGETYLRADLIIDAARRSGADAIHPGYGFLSENADFARAVIGAGLTWIGPTPESIDAMGSKVAAKKLMVDAGVPVFAELDPSAVTAADLPILVKASAGGGGRGMRIVRDLADLADQVQLASDEAASAFGDPTVFCEPYLENGRHVEVQVLGDTFGMVVVLGERDCSLQRRHQKVVEEAPAPGLSDEVRRVLHDGARLAAETIGYVGAGTVEFMVSGERVSFLEMNTRLQVEHPVTEAVFGVDLVAAQIAVAEGRALATMPTHPRGHAIEVRLYAEDPAADFQPQSGRLRSFDVPADLAFEQFATYGVRLDSGFVDGNEVSTHYDAMLAKVICWAPTREEALRQLAGVLRRSHLHGLRTNRDLLVELLGHPVVVAGEMTTNFIGDADLTSLAANGSAVEDLHRTAGRFAAVVALTEESVQHRVVQHRIPSGWRNVVSAPQREVFQSGEHEVQVGWLRGRQGLEYVELDETARETGAAASIRAVAASASAPGVWSVQLDADGLTLPFTVFVDGEHVDVEGPSGHLALRRLPRFVDPADQVSAGSLLAPMPGTVIAIPGVAGSTVAAGDPLLVLEAMKMQHTISAPSDGVLEIAVAVGQQVSAGDVLAVVTDNATTEVEEQSA